MTVRASVTASLIFAASCTGWIGDCGAQALETESARFLRGGAYELGTAFEYQTSAQGTERAVPLALEYGLTDRLSLLAEPVIYTSIRPKRGAPATDVGDLEVTSFYLLQVEGVRRPALAIAAEVKFPTTRNTLIGTGRTDLSGYVIASKRFGRLDLHANAGYTIFGQPSGTQLNNIVNGAFAGEYQLDPRFVLFCEVLGNTSSSPEGGGDNPTSMNAIFPEAAGGELVGTLGLGVFPIRELLVSVGLSYDNNHALLVRPGVAWRLRR